MAAVEKRTISLPAEQAGYIDALVAEGTYASASEVVRRGCVPCRSGTPRSSVGCVRRWHPSMTPCRQIPPARFRLIRSFKPCVRITRNG